MWGVVVWLIIRVGGGWGVGGGVGGGVWVGWGGCVGGGGQGGGWWWGGDWVGWWGRGGVYSYCSNYFSEEEKIEVPPLNPLEQ